MPCLGLVLAFVLLQTTALTRDEIGNDIPNQPQKMTDTTRFTKDTCPKSAGERPNQSSTASSTNPSTPNTGFPGRSSEQEKSFSGSKDPSPADVRTCTFLGSTGSFAEEACLQSSLDKQKTHLVLEIGTYSVTDVTSGEWLSCEVRLNDSSLSYVTLNATEELFSVSGTLTVACPFVLDGVSSIGTLAVPSAYAESPKYVFGSTTIKAVDLASDGQDGTPFIVVSNTVTFSLPRDENVKHVQISDGYQRVSLTAPSKNCTWTAGGFHEFDCTSSLCNKTFITLVVRSLMTEPLDEWNDVV